MKNVWFISDTHFSHINIIRYCKRPFVDHEIHDAALISNWNGCVKDGDDVYFLGDFCFRSRTRAKEIRQKLRGQIFFIEGNHDSAAHQIRQTFAWYHQVKMVKVNDQLIWLSHYAHRVWDRSHYSTWHLYGHCHHSLPDDPFARSLDVGVDATAVRLGRPDIYGSGTIPDSGLRPEDYRPIHFDEIAELMQRKQFKPIDHHGQSETPQE
ncbi:MAG: phosphoesterase [Phycisphaerales bacterium]|nr:phosphoesterase [Phycisphaerales bacterium]